MADDTSDPPLSTDVSPSRFDDAELPPARRVKPLPKRRRMIDPVMMGAASGNVANATQISSSEVSAAADKLADALSTSMALQSHYMPIFGGIPSFDKGDTDSRLDIPFTFQLGEDLRRDEVDFGGEGDYIDHLQQPENKKKRKVPVTGTSRLGDDGLSGDEELGEQLVFPAGYREPIGVMNFPSPAQVALDVLLRKGKLSPPTKAALQHKELLKNRKRQLATVLGALSQGDTLALDQALSTAYPFARGEKEQDSRAPAVRRSRRPARRKTRPKPLSSQDEDRRPFILSDDVENLDLSSFSFSFECDSATSDRLRATKKEVAYLHDRFEAELSRQATKATELAREAAALAASQMSKTKRNEQRSQRRANRSGGERGGNTGSLDGDQTLVSMSGKAKKKKRSAMANASNPHHLRNYVPSRLPHSGPLHAASNAQSNIGPLALRFLSAELPPRRRKANVSPVGSLVNPADEWICAFCEYKLFFGDDHDQRRAVRHRKKILSRRRRAMERAAAAASGKKKASPAQPLDRSDDDESLGDDMADAFEDMGPDASSPSNTAKAKAQKDRDRDKEMYR